MSGCAKHALKWLFGVDCGVRHRTHGRSETCGVGSGRDSGVCEDYDCRTYESVHGIVATATRAVDVDPIVKADGSAVVTALRDAYAAVVGGVQGAGTSGAVDAGAGGVVSAERAGAEATVRG